MKKELKERNGETGHTQQDVQSLDNFKECYQETINRNQQKAENAFYL